MRDFETELIYPATRERLKTEVLEGHLSSEELIALVNAASYLGLGEMLPTVGSLLDNADANVRICVLNALSFAFSADDFISQVLQIFHSDSDEDVRAAAAMAVGTSARRRMDLSLLRKLRASMNNNDEPLVVRDAARRAFLYALGRPYSDRQALSFEDASRIDIDLLPDGWHTPE
jgi:HEAT repeats